VASSAARTKRGMARAVAGEAPPVFGTAALRRDAVARAPAAAAPALAAAPRKRGAEGDR